MPAYSAKFSPSGETSPNAGVRSGARRIRTTCQTVIAHVSGAAAGSEASKVRKKMIGERFGFPARTEGSAGVLREPPALRDPAPPGDVATAGARAKLICSPRLYNLYNS